MSEEKLSPEDEKALNQLVNAVAKALAGGQSKGSIVKQLVEDGWEQSAAEDFVGNVEREVRAAQARGGGEGRSFLGGAGSWLIWIGLLLFVNFLSWVFDWSFWIY